MTFSVITNNVPRDIIDAWQLSARERAEFDYLDWQAIDACNDSASFFRYMGRTYDLSQFVTTASLGAPEEFRNWDGYQSDSFFSGMVVRYERPGYERIIVGRYFS